MKKQNFVGTKEWCQEFVNTAKTVIAKDPTGLPVIELVISSLAKEQTKALKNGVIHIAFIEFNYKEYLDFYRHRGGNVYYVHPESDTQNIGLFNIPLSDKGFDIILGWLQEEADKLIEFYE